MRVGSPSGHRVPGHPFRAAAPVKVLAAGLTLFLTGGVAMTADGVDYRCLFNHELLIVSHRKDNSAEYIASFIRKLGPTDVDAVLCCPQMWRTHTFPSRIDLTWRRYTPGQPLSAFKSYDYMMTYLHGGGDPVRETLDACRTYRKAFFISYRMNDHHYVQDVTWPCHNDFWRDHPEYWLADADTSPYQRSRDDVRLHNYMLAPVRDYTFAMIEELCTTYDVDGLELDFQRFPRFFRNAEIEAGRAVMTAFVGRIRSLLDRLGAARAKRLRLCVRVPHTIAGCEAAGLDVLGWDRAGLVDMINVSSFYIHTIELGIEEFRERTSRARIYGEMNYVTYQNSKVSTFARRYTTIEAYRGSALNLLSRGVDGLSLFNYDYVPADRRLAMAEGLKGITDMDALESLPKAYVVYPGFGTFPAKDRQTVALAIPDDTSRGTFARALLRVETEAPCGDLPLRVRLNGTALEECAHEGVELFPPVAQNAGYASRDRVRFFAVPLERILTGRNEVQIENMEAERRSCRLFSLEIGLCTAADP